MITKMTLEDAINGPKVPGAMRKLEAALDEMRDDESRSILERAILSAAAGVVSAAARDQEDEE